MDVTAWLLRRTPPRPLVVTAPGGTGARLAVERVVRERGWRPATSPAEANVLVVAGMGGVEPYVERVWEQLPAPRARADVHTAAAAEERLEAAVAELRDVGRQRQQATRPALTAHETEHADHQDHDPHQDHGGGMHHGAMDHGGGHETHGHHGHDMGGMAMPGGVPMADRAEDRDGLMLDQLHVPLGPVLADWPAGLIVHTSLQGDVIQHATVEVLPGGAAEPSRSEPARALDACARLLAVAGWADASATARRLRDTALAGSLDTDLLARWTSRVRRSRTLRWLLTDVGATPDDPTTPPGLRGDALARLYRWLAPTETGRTDHTPWTLANLPALLEGSELATARLIVASLDPDLDRQEVHHG